jgi:hypothetical protein
MVRAFPDTVVLRDEISHSIGILVTFQDGTRIASGTDSRVRVQVVCFLERANDRLDVAILDMKLVLMSVH